MLRLLKRLYIWVFSARTALPDTTSDNVAVAPRPRNVAKTAPSEDSGEFYFREAILDQLGYYTKCIARMQRADPEAYDLYGNVGGHILPENALSWFGKIGAFDSPTQQLAPHEPLSPWFRQTLPTFGAVFVGKVARDVEDGGKAYIPRFYYFRRYDRLRAPAEVQRPVSGAVYVATIYWDNVEQRGKWKCRFGVPQDYPLVIAPDGSVKLLRQLSHTNNQIRHKRGKDRGRLSTLPGRRWVPVNPWFEMWSREYGSNAEQFLTALFVQTANLYEAANSSMIRIMASKGKVTASFGVDVKRTPYFFRDRDMTLTDSGSKRRIFHIVRPHSRKNGSAVKFHFRGERKFKWNDYEINIMVPGRDVLNIAEFNVPIIDGDRIKEGQDTIGTKELARKLRSNLVDGTHLKFGRSARR